jgi:oligoendopeptidase F
LFNGNLKSNIFYAKARNIIQQEKLALFKNNIPLSVYDNLVETVNKNLAPMYRWASLKKKLLGLMNFILMMFMLLCLIKNLKKNIHTKNPLKLVLDSLQVMGEDYLTSLKKAFDKSDGLMFMKQKLNAAELILRVQHLECILMFY